jgi:asparagine synthase (glutamine-hydrolysing)
LLPEIVNRLDQPTTGGINWYIISQAARQGGITVSFSGLGADEIFAGYQWLASNMPLNGALSGKASTPLWKVLGKSGIYKYLPYGKIHDYSELTKLSRNLSIDFMLRHRASLPSYALRLVGSAEIKVEDLFDQILLEDRISEADEYAKFSRLAMKFWMNSHELRDLDIASMAHSLEVRVPFLDVDLVDFAYGLPISSKVGPIKSSRNIYRKRILIQSVQDIIPEWTYSSPKKGFELPYPQWLRGPFRPIVEQILSDRWFKQSGILDSKEVDRTWSRFLQGRTNWGSIWTILIIGLYFNHIEKDIKF